MANNVESNQQNYGAYAAAAASAVSTFGNANMSKRQQRAQNKFNLDMWSLNNEYNSPQSQMQRYKDAGLNPNLIYGQGNSGNSSAPPVQTAAPNVPGKGIGHMADDLAYGFSVLQNLKELEMKNAQIENIKDQNVQIRNQAQGTLIDNAVKELYNFGRQYSIQYSDGKGNEARKEDFPLWLRMQQNYVGQSNKNQLQTQDMAIKKLLATGMGSKNKILEYQSDPYMYFGTSILKSMAPYLQKLPSFNRVTRSRR